MPYLLLYGFTDAEISVFPGTFLRVEISQGGETTKKPIETGATITDHTTVEALHVSATLHVSPVHLRDRASTVERAVALLARIKAARSVSTLTGDAGSFEELILDSWRTPRDGAENSVAAEIEVEFTQIKYIQTEVSTPVPRHPRNVVPVNRGSVSTEEPDTSFGASAFEALTGMGLIHSRPRAAQ